MFNTKLLTRKISQKRTSFKISLAAHIDRVQIWTIQNNLYVEVFEEYNLKYDPGIVIDRYPDPETSIFRGLDNQIRRSDLLCVLLVLILIERGEENVYER